MIAWIVQHSQSLNENTTKVEHCSKICLPSQNDLPSGEPGNELSVFWGRQLVSPVILTCSCRYHGNQFGERRDDCGVSCPYEEKAPESSCATTVNDGDIECPAGSSVQVSTSNRRTCVNQASQVTMIVQLNPTMDHNPNLL